MPRPIEPMRSQLKDQRCGLGHRKAKKDGAPKGAVHQSKQVTKREEACPARLAPWLFASQGVEFNRKGIQRSSEEIAIELTNNRNRGRVRHRNDVTRQWRIRTDRSL
ncbi:MAG: hypothetical protein ACI8TX_001310 [Hyphomicrobiaceae bacterium]|jgi:hypothetical protein